MTCLPFEFIDRRCPQQSVDSTTDSFDEENAELNATPNPCQSLPTVQELRERLRLGDIAPQPKASAPIADDAGIAIGVDVARFGADSTAICVRNGQRVVHLASYRKEDTMVTAGRVAAAIRHYSPNDVFIDAIGIGAGVVDRLKELRFRNVHGVNVSTRANDPRNYLNLRAEIFDALRKRFEQGTIQLPHDPELAEQLASLKYSFTSSGQIQLDSKELMSSAGLRSPDKADALALAFSFRRRPLKAWL